MSTLSDRGLHIVTPQAAHVSGNGTPPTKTIAHVFWLDKLKWWGHINYQKRSEGKKRLDTILYLKPYIIQNLSLGSRTVHIGNVLWQLSRESKCGSFVPLWARIPRARYHPRGLGRHQLGLYISIYGECKVVYFWKRSLNSECRVLYLWLSHKCMYIYIYL